MRNSSRTSVQWCRSSMTTSPCANRCQTCCGSSVFVAEAFPSAGALLASEAVNHTSCLLLDVAMPGMSGPDLQQELTRRNQTIPIVFITANGDSTIRSRLLARGAVECLFKPLSEAALLDAIGSALRPR